MFGSSTATLNPAFKSIWPDDEYVYIYKKDFQLLQKALKTQGTY